MKNKTVIITGAASGIGKATAALEYSAQGLRVNAVGPGFIDTPL